MNVKKVLEIVSVKIMRWVFEICLFEPNGELQIPGARFTQNFDALVFPTDGT